MDQRNDIRDFLISRRSRITPEQAGLPAFGTKRRVPGLRREEVALLAGVSVDYYTRLERGNLGGVSDAVLGAVAKVLQLDDAERAHLFALAKTSTPSRRERRKPDVVHVRPSVQRILDALVGAPAWVQNERLDVLATNELCRALNPELYDDPDQPVNLAKFVFLDPRASDYFSDWARQADNAVAMLRIAAGRDPYHTALSNLVGELSTRSDDFRVRWGAHDVRFHRSGSKRLNNPIVGELDLAYEALELPADPGLTLYVLTAEPSSPADDRLKILCSWASANSSTRQ